MIDRDVIDSKMRFLREYLQDLEAYAGITLAQYRASKKDQRYVERTLHLACESCLDIANHLISRKGFREAKDNKDLFIILNENGVLTDSVQSAMVKMAQFRNIVVHDYTRIDPGIVVGILNRNLDDFRSFARDVLLYLDND